MAVTLDSVMSALRTVKDPNSGKDVMVLGLIHDLKMQDDTVSLKMVVPGALAASASTMEQAVKEALVRLAGATEVELKLEQKGGGGHSHGASGGKGKSINPRQAIPGIKHIVAVSSGKGGVGKSTVAANLACTLGKLDYRVGLLDTDVYGPNIPTMMGLAGKMPEVRMDEKRGELIIPLEAHGIKVMSMGFLTKGDQPLIWRGPMLHSVVNQFLLQVDWGDLDYLIVDMPPGTGDVQLSLTQLVPLSGAVVVTTPQEVSLQDVRKAILMFEKVEIPILGVVENMSFFVCDKCDKHHDIFGKDGGALLADKFRIPLLGQLPLLKMVCEAGDSGAPVSMKSGAHPLSLAFLRIAEALVVQIQSRSVVSH